MDINQLHYNIQSSLKSFAAHEGTNVKFAERIGESKQSVGHWINGKHVPDIETLAKIASIYKVPLSMILNGGVSEAKLNREAGYVEVPLLGRIAAGTPIEMDAVENTFSIPQPVYDRYPQSFLLIVDGESMSRVLPDGCYALIDPSKKSDVINGKTYAVCVNGYDATIKRVKKLSNGFELIPDSNDPTYHPVVYDYSVEGTDTITILGEVVWYTLPYDWTI